MLNSEASNPIPPNPAPRTLHRTPSKIYRAPRLSVSNLNPSLHPLSQSRRTHPPMRPMLVPKPRLRWRKVFQSQVQVYSTL